jgi:hypothetical protein
VSRYTPCNRYLTRGAPAGKELNRIAVSTVTKAIFLI